MTTTAPPTTSATSARLPRGLAVAAATAGALLVVEALDSPFVDSHLGYHGPNLVQNAAVAVACWLLARGGPEVRSRAGAVGAWLGVVGGGLACVGGVLAVLVEGLTSKQTPGVAEGVTHTAVLLAFLAVVPLGLGLRGVLRGPGRALAAAGLVVMALAFVVDDPWWYVGPEAALGVAWLWLASRAR